MKIERLNISRWVKTEKSRRTFEIVKMYAVNVVRVTNVSQNYDNPSTTLVQRQY